MRGTLGKVREGMNEKGQGKEDEGGVERGHRGKGGGREGGKGMRMGRRSGEEGGEEMVIRCRYCLQGFPGPMGESTIRRLIRSKE